MLMDSFFFCFFFVPESDVPTCLNWQTMESARNTWKSSYSIRSKVLCWFCLLWILTTTCFECFVALATSGPYQSWFSTLMSCQVTTFSNNRVVVWAWPFPFPWQCWSDIRYEYWKRLALWNRKDLAYETKPTVCKHKQKQMQLSSNKHDVILQRSPINKKNSWCAHGLGWKNGLWNNKFYD